MIDLKLIEECRKGNLGNFRKLIELTSPFAFSVAFRMLGDEELAKEIVQETMITIWQKLNKIKSAGVYKSWTYRIVVNKCYDQLRKRKGRIEFVADEKAWAIILDTISDNSITVLEKEEAGRLLNLLTEKLSPKQKAVFILSDLEEMSQDEIAAVTGMSKMLIKANLHHARKKISEMIERYL